MLVEVGGDLRRVVKTHATGVVHGVAAAGDAIEAGAAVFDGGGGVEEGFFDFPVALFGADAEFKVFFGDGVPILKKRGCVVNGMCPRQKPKGDLISYLVHHHDTE